MAVDNKNFLLISMYLYSDVYRFRKKQLEILQSNLKILTFLLFRTAV